MADTVPLGKVPRIARRMALAIRCDELIQGGTIAEQSELARFGQVTMARTTQLISLMTLTPDIQEAIRFLPRTTQGCDVIKETDVRRIAATLAGANNADCGPSGATNGSRPRTFRGELSPGSAPKGVAYKQGVPHPKRVPAAPPPTPPLQPPNGRLGPAQTPQHSPPELS